LTALAVCLPLLAANVPVEDFFRPAALASPVISPDAKHIAFIRGEGWKSVIGVLEIGSGQIRVFEPAKRENAAWVRWASNDRLVFGIHVDFEGANSSTVYTTGGIYAVDRDGGKPRDLFASSAGLLNLLPNDPDHILVEYGDGVYRVNVYSGAHKLVQKPFAHVRDWDVDSDGEVRLGFSVEDDRQDVFYRAKGAKDFSKLRSLSLTTPEFNVIAFDDASERLWVISNEGRDTSALFHFDLKTRELAAPVLSPVGFDFIGSLRRLGGGNRIVGATFTTDRPEFHAFDPDEAVFQAEIDRRLPETFNQVTSQSQDGSACIVRAASDVRPGHYFLCYRNPFRLKQLGETSPWLKPEDLQPMKPIQFGARDGLKVHGYLTSPKGVLNKQPPLVVFPHGGPWTRDFWGFDPMVQFLANRGYAVLQVNFRGSIGYGDSFMEAGYKQWGRQMQDDITDGVRSLIAKGQADPERVGIYGASYGGYAAMSGLCFTPELYRCGVNVCGVTDMRAFIQGIPKRRRLLRSNMEKMVGDPKVDSGEMKARSPLHNVERIQVPVLLAYGRNDRIVDIKHGDRFARELRKQGKGVTYIAFPDEGHGFHHRDNQLKFYGELEQFLDRHLKFAPPRKP
jgi:dipeptidyl aminopeptidase/acylaminoacyl peptidase